MSKTELEYIKEEEVEISKPPQDNDKIFIEEPIRFSEEQMNEILNMPEYEEGIRIAARYAGIYSTLLAFGMSVDDAITFSLTDMTTNYNIKLQEIVNNGIKIQNNIIKSQTL